MSDLSSLLGQQFAFAHGRIGVLQQLLMKTADTDRLLGARDVRETESILTELKITSLIDQSLKKADPILRALEKWIRAEVEQMSPIAKRPAFHILWIQGDAPLLAYLLKKFHRLSSSVSEEPKSGLSAYEPEALRALVEEDTATQLPSHLVEFVQRVRKMAKPTPQEIDSAVSQFVADLQLKLARTSGSKSIKEHVQHRIDLTNIRTALRTVEEDSIKEFIHGGSISSGTLNGSLKEIQATVERDDLGYFLSDALKKEDVTAFERACADVIAADIAQMWNVPLSIEPLFAFASIAMTQLSLIRVILISKRNGLSPQETKALLPPFLSASHYLI